MKVKYDLHLHSCLSPCGDMDMTPNNIVNMAKLLGYDIIALTDHNSSLNCEAAMKVGENVGLPVVPGMELTTSEDIHAVCLFPDLEKALRFNEYVSEHQIKIKNRTEIYGRQVIMNENDEETGEVDNLLILATDISIMDAYETVKSFEGICYPAHIDRDSLSVLSVLGEIPWECNFTTAEISYDGNRDILIKNNEILKTLNIVTSSDAHYLENMKDPLYEIELDEISQLALVNFLSKRL